MQKKTEIKIDQTNLPPAKYQLILDELPTLKLNKPLLGEFEECNDHDKNVEAAEMIGNKTSTLKHKNPTTEEVRKNSMKQGTDHFEANVIKNVVRSKKPAVNHVDEALDLQITRIISDMASKTIKDGS